ncbi:hypothetical protein Loa_00686 [Legionella oakridgensis ATCC 33761 = DSM 21215]|uniref:Fusaric acid resistance protein family n=1 Tax=Legionella oakridgensis ATCC 33761 = DSM 21215 TaxID=1268635 RepID=W0B8T7_9GAMM|nr:hypothetical protein [Legionella oakridgensis]AHE66255.1 hypothetical protein Loa_00686 [Legionella oakridgensis ATCC 33761 = DSM 21215]
MFISKLSEWWDEVDPYALQRLAMYKACFVATILVYIYWVFKPANFMAFFAPFIVASFYEMPLISSFKEKEFLLLFIFVAMLVVSISFYLLAPMHFMFLFYALGVLATLYYLVLKFFPQLKNLTMLILAAGAMTLTIKPPAHFQIAIEMFSSSILSMGGILICLKIFPNKYLYIWCRALQKFIQCLESDIQAAISTRDKYAIVEEVNHLGMMRACRKLIPKRYLIHTYRMSVNIRNIQFALDNLFMKRRMMNFGQALKIICIF